MPEKILKHVKVTYECQSCRKRFSKRCIVAVKKVSIKQISKEIKTLPFAKMPCKCGEEDFKTSFQFFNEEQL